MKDLMLIWYLTTEISNLAPYILCFQKIDFICYMKFTSDGQIFWFAKLQLDLHGSGHNMLKLNSVFSCVVEICVQAINNFWFRLKK